MMLFAIPIISQLEAVMRHVLTFFHSSLGLTWAWSIVATTVLVRMILVPLTVKQIHSMQILQKLRAADEGDPEEVQAATRRSRTRS